MDMVHQARVFAVKAHGDQSYGGYPYVRHLAQVDHVLLQHGLDDLELRASAYLHDVLEDTSVSLDTLVELFGTEVGFLVYAVTDLPGKNRNERKRKTYRQLKHLAVLDQRVVTLKLADRIANVAFSIQTRNDLMLRMYQKEHPTFVSFLRRLGSPGLWSTLNGVISTPCGRGKN